MYAHVDMPNDVEEEEERTKWTARRSQQRKDISGLIIQTHNSIISWQMFPVVRLAFYPNGCNTASNWPLLEQLPYHDRKTNGGTSVKLYTQKPR